MAFASGSLAKDFGMFSWTYNRENYKFDQELRFERYTTGRKMAVSQVDMFREDVSDLASVAISKLKIYAPIMTMSCGYCITVFVEGRSGLKFPGPPVFVSGMYLQCLGIGFAFLTLGTWLAFHAALRAQIAAVQIRTRKVRLPVPTQRQLDSARKLLSTYEEQCVYDQLKIPLIMPNSAKSPHASDDEAKSSSKDHKTTYTHAGLPGVAANVAGKVRDHFKKAGVTRSDVATSVRMPGTTAGNPSWIKKEMEARDKLPKASPSGFGCEGPPEPLAHFEYVRKAQKEYWAAEAYCRVCFLFGMMHLIQAFAYWLVIHNIAELGMVWCAPICAATLTAGIWLMFRLDVLPELGGVAPVEASGPFVAAITLSLMYTGTITERIIDISRGVAVLILIMHLIWTFRLYSVAKPGHGAPTHAARESGGHLFNRSASCEVPSWLPRAFQHVTYLVAPPKTKEQLEQERTDREGKSIQDDPLVDVDMSPWYYVRVLLMAVLLGWLTLLTGRVVESIMGERMIVTNPGAPPWTRVGQWNGWESGPITSKHYAHVTPMKGHFAWRKGWGPQGQQEIWASDMFGFHPESDAHWAEDEGPEPLVGSAGHGENTWAEGYLSYGNHAPSSHPVGGGHGFHDWDDSNGHRRLRGVEAVTGLGWTMAARPPLVPAAVLLPATLEPELLACSPRGGEVLMLTAAGLGAMVPPQAAAGQGAGTAVPFTLEGLLEVGMARGISWTGNTSLAIVTGAGVIVSCQTPANGVDTTRCIPMGGPRLPSFGMHGSADANAGAVPGFGAVMGPVTVVDAQEGRPMSVAMSAPGGRVIIFLQLISGPQGVAAWRQVAEVAVPTTESGIVYLSASHGQLLALSPDGSSFSWKLENGKPLSGPQQDVPAVDLHRTWHAACPLPAGKIVRLASSWRRVQGKTTVAHQELLI